MDYNDGHVEVLYDLVKTIQLAPETIQWYKVVTTTDENLGPIAELVENGDVKSNGPVAKGGSSIQITRQGIQTVCDLVEEERIILD
jgi:hypothetical protein